MMYPPPKTQPITPMKPTHHPTVRITKKAVTLSREAADLLNVRHGDRISFEQEEGAKAYLYVKAVPMHGYVLHAQNDRLFVYSRSLARRILDITGSAGTALFRLGDPTKDYIGNTIIPIITSINYAERN